MGRTLHDSLEGKTERLSTELFELVCHQQELEDYVETPFKTVTNEDLCNKLTEIVEHCRETGEDPVSCLDLAVGARHF